MSNDITLIYEQDIVINGLLRTFFKCKLNTLRKLSPLGAGKWSVTWHSLDWSKKLVESKDIDFFMVVQNNIPDNAQERHIG